MADCLTLILQGDILTAITCTWTNLIGLSFYAIMLAALEIAIYLKYDNIQAPAIMGSFIGILMVYYIPPAISMIPLGILIMNIAVVIYSVLFSRG